MAELLSNPQVWISLLTLTILEIVLGVDNIVFISILAGKLPADQQEKARRLGLTLAMATRILFLLSIGFIMRMTAPIFTIPGFDAGGEGGFDGGISVRDLILLLGGLFLIAKATHEIHGKLEGQDGEVSVKVMPTMSSVVMQILLIDIVFSIDSVVTAVGMAQHVEVMIAAVVISVVFMLLFVGVVSRFVDAHPTVKMLALSFLILIGVNLVADGFGFHIPKGYTYFAMAFSVGVEMLNLRLRPKGKPVHLHQAVAPEDSRIA